MPIRLYNTFTRQIEDFSPREQGHVRMYNCGPTVYSSPHIGNFRSFLLADLLRRFLEWRGLQVTQIMNLTDVGHLQHEEEDTGEDKMEAAARRERATVWQIAQRYTDEFFAAAKTVNIRPAHEYPRATDHIPEMIEMVGRLVENGHAYVADSGNVYFEVGRFEDYGKLSGNRGDDLLAGARIEVNDEKRDPRDFALWKIDPLHQMQWDAPWGRGFPGWHIECSAMSKKYLGTTLDLHTGGEDNVFPHHECEIAQSEGSCGEQFVRHWMHARHLLVDGKKMSKSLGNFHTIDDLLERGYEGDAIRLALMRVHYREQLNFTMQGLDESARKIERFRECRRKLAELAAAGEPSPEITELIDASRERFGAALDDDLNIAVAQAELDALVSAANRRQPDPADAAAFLAGLGDLWSVLGLLEQEASVEDDDLDPRIEGLVKERNDARAQKDFARADEIRDQLKAEGIELIDSPDGVKWRRTRPS